MKLRNCKFVISVTCLVDCTLILVNLACQEIGIKRSFDYQYTIFNAGEFLNNVDILIQTARKQGIHLEFFCWCRYSHSLALVCSLSLTDEVSKRLRRKARVTDARQRGLGMISLQEQIIVLQLILWLLWVMDLTKQIINIILGFMILDDQLQLLVPVNKIFCL